MIPGQYAVAQVTMNRAREPRRVCQVVTAPHQFSWTTDALVKVGDKFVLKARHMPKEKHAWELALHIARYTLTHRPADVTRGATHYHATYVQPAWRTSMERTKLMGRHVFYKPSTKSAVTGKA